LGAGLTETDLSNDNLLIPSQIRSRFGEDRNIKIAHFYSANIKGGYGYTFAFTPKWFTSLAFNLGFGSLMRIYSDSTAEYKEAGASSKGDGMITFGYNGDNFLAAVIIVGDITTYTTRSLEIPRGLWTGRIAIGGHF
jgi:hypothetical protein